MNYVIRDCQANIEIDDSLKVKVNSFEDSFKNLEKRVDESFINLENREKRLEESFINLEKRLTAFETQYSNMLAYYYMHGDLYPHLNKTSKTIDGKKVKMTTCYWLWGGDIKSVSLPGHGWKLINYSEIGKMIVKRRRKYKYIDLITKEIDDQWILC